MNFWNDSLKRAYPAPHFCDFLNYERFDPKTGLFYQKDGSVGFVMESLPLVGNSEAMQKEISGWFQYTLPEKSCYQCLLYADPHVEDLKKTYIELRQDPFLKTMAQERFLYLEQLSHAQERVAGMEEAFPLRRFRAIHSVSVAGDKATPALLETLQIQLRLLLQAQGVGPKSWTPQDAMTFLSTFLGLSPSPAYDKRQALDEQMRFIGSKVTVHDAYVSTHQSDQPCQKIRTFCVDDAPPFWSLYMMSELIGDVFRPALRVASPFYLCYSAYILDQEAQQTTVMAGKSWVDKQVRHENIRRHLPHLAEQAEEYQHVKEAMDRGETLIQSSFHAGLIAHEHTLDANETALKNLFLSKGWRLRANDYVHFPLLLSHLPLGTTPPRMEELKRLFLTKTTLSSESVNVLPLQGEWCGTPTAGLLLNGRRGQVMTFSPFDNQNGNYNVSVAGRSGAGKSVFMQDLMLSMLSTGARVFVMDVGRSFEKVCKLLEGEFVAFDTQHPLSVNPFTRLHDMDEKDRLEGFALLKPIISLMVAPKKGTTDQEDAAIEKGVHGAYALYGKQCSLSLLAQWFLDQEAPLMKTLGERLYPYTQHGMYGAFFNPPATSLFQKDLVVIEMEELKERKDLQSVIVQMVILQITQQMFCGDRSRPFMMIFDEAWDLLRGDSSGVFIETLARRLRKYNGSLVVGTQSINDFYATPAAQAAFDNSDWTILLSQKAESIELLKKSSRLHMKGDHMEDLLKSLTTKHGQYADVLVYGQSGYAVGRLLLDSFSKALYSTTPKDFARLQSLQKQGYALQDALKILAGLESDSHAPMSSMKAA